MKTLILFFAAFFFLFCVFSAAWAGKGNIDLKVKGQTLSANLKDVSLNVIFEKLEREKGIWFRGDETFFADEVSVQFTALSMEDGLKRILAPLNYSLVFDSNSQIAGVVIIGKKRSSRAMANRNAVLASEISPPQSKKRQPDIKGTFKETKNIHPPGGPVKVTEEELKVFKVIKNSPPPGGSINVSPEELNEFKVKKNLPPPGGPVKVSAENFEQFKVIKNCPPPGG